MCFIQKENGEIIHDNSSITQEAKKFYEKLYASHENYIINIDFGNIATPTLSQEESDSREGPITLHEALSALKQMKNDKSRDWDGYTVEFFLIYLFNYFSQTWAYLWFALLIMVFTVVKCQSHKDKGYT